MTSSKIAGSVKSKSDRKNKLGTNRRHSATSSCIWHDHSFVGTTQTQKSYRRQPRSMGLDLRTIAPTAFFCDYRHTIVHVFHIFSDRHWNLAKELFPSRVEVAFRLLMERRHRAMLLDSIRSTFKIINSLVRGVGWVQRLLWAESARNGDYDGCLWM